jgi:hypothetical protein
MLSMPSNPAYYNSAFNTGRIGIPTMPTHLASSLQGSPSFSTSGQNTQNSPQPGTEKPATSPLRHLGNAGMLVLGAIILKRLPANTVHPQLHSPLLSSDWKEWAKVGLGIGAMSQTTQALNWKPPLWLQAMLNVAVVGPMVAGVTKRNVIQSAILAPIVAGMVQGTQWASEKSEGPLQQKFNIPPPVTHALFSFGMVLAGLRVFPWVNSAIPLAKDTTASRAGLMSTCANGCCSSLVCVNDIGQLGSSLAHSISPKNNSNATRSPFA